MAEFKTTLVKEKETKGAVKYNEVDANGQPLGMYDGKVGVQYIRKQAFGDQPIPAKITLTVNWQ